MIVGDAASHCNGSSTFSFRVAIGSINVVILNMKPLMGFQMSLKTGPHLYASPAAVY
jgi:hypothetical protein